MCDRGRYEGRFVIILLYSFIYEWVALVFFRLVETKIDCKNFYHFHLFSNKKIGSEILVINLSGTLEK